MKKIKTFLIYSLIPFVGISQDWPADPNFIYFGTSTLNQSVAGNYALLQYKVSGSTFLNSPDQIYLRLNNADQMTVTSTGVNFHNGFNNAWPHTPGFTYFGATTLDQSQAGNYALVQNKNNGATFLNSPNQVYIRLNNADQMTVTPTGVNFHNGFENDSPVHPTFTYFGSTTLDQTQPGNYALLQQKNTGLTLLNSPQEIHFRINNSDKMKLSNAGNFGIGTISPSYPIHVKSTGAGGHLAIETNSAGEGDIQWFQGETINDNQRASLQLNATNGDFEAWVHDTQWVKWLRVSRSTSNVGIGIEPGSVKLAVGGTIASEEVKVEINPGQGPDYVFEESYQLRSLEETKQFISENKHLPEIPSAREMEQDGILLADMNMRLLKKIEELTLHQIELMELVKEQQLRIDQLEKK